MTVQHDKVTVATTATNLLGAFKADSSVDTDVDRSVLITNVSGVGVYIGGAGVTTASYGYLLPAGAWVAIDLDWSDVPFAVVAASTADVRVLHTGVN